MTKKQKLKVVAKRAIKKLAKPTKKVKKVEFYSRLHPSTKAKVVKVKRVMKYRSLCEATEKMLAAMCDEILSAA